MTDFGSDDPDVLEAIEAIPVEEPTTVWVAFINGVRQTYVVRNFYDGPGALHLHLENDDSVRLIPWHRIYEVVSPVEATQTPPEAPQSDEGVADDRGAS
jgi:hypothetical protein